MPLRAVTFDFGQTIAELDTDMLANRVLERGVEVSRAALDAAVSTAWAAYDRAIAAGHGGHPWHHLMRTLLNEGGVAANRLDDLVDWLWDEQPKKNLWRRPIPGVIDVIDEIASQGTPIGIISNSEGRLAELIEELGWSRYFPVVADSGRLEMEKPSPAIFEWTAEKLEVQPSEIVHVGDSWMADIDGALGVGMRAIWFGGATGAPPPPAERVPHSAMQMCKSAQQLRTALIGWGVLNSG